MSRSDSRYWLRADRLLGNSVATGVLEDAGPRRPACASPPARTGDEYARTEREGARAEIDKARSTERHCERMGLPKRPFQGFEKQVAGCDMTRLAFALMAIAASYGTCTQSQTDVRSTYGDNYDNSENGHTRTSRKAGLGHDHRRDQETRTGHTKWNRHRDSGRHSLCATRQIPRRNNTTPQKDTAASRVP